MQISKKQITCSQLFPPFLKSRSIFQHFLKKDPPEPIYFRNYGVPKALLEKCLKNPIREHFSTINTVKGPKHSLNLDGRTFIKFFIILGEIEYKNGYVSEIPEV